MALQGTGNSTLVKREVLHSELIEEPWDHADFVTLRLRHESFKPFLSKVPQPGHAKRIFIHAPGTDSDGNLVGKLTRHNYTLLAKPGPDGSPVAALDLTSVRRQFVKDKHCKVLYNDKLLIWGTDKLDYFLLELVKETCWLCHKETDDSDPTLGEVYVCDGCDRSVHSKCAGLTRKLLEDEDFYCEDCKSKGVPAQKAAEAEAEAAAAKVPQKAALKHGKAAKRQRAHGHHGAGRGRTVGAEARGAADGPGGSRDGLDDTRNTVRGVPAGAAGQATAAAAAAAGEPGQCAAGTLLRDDRYMMALDREAVLARCAEDETADAGKAADAHTLLHSRSSLVPPQQPAEADGGGTVAAVLAASTDAGDGARRASAGELHGRDRGGQPPAAQPTSQPQAGEPGRSEQQGPEQQQQQQPAQQQQGAAPDRLEAGSAHDRERQPQARQEPQQQPLRKRPRPHEQHKGKQAQLPPALRHRGAEASGSLQPPSQTAPPPLQQLPQPRHEGPVSKPDGGPQQGAVANDQQGAEGSGAVAIPTAGSGGDAVRDAVGDAGAADVGRTAHNIGRSTGQPLYATAPGAEGVDHSAHVPSCAAAPLALPVASPPVPPPGSGKRLHKTAHRTGGEVQKAAAEHGTSAAAAAAAAAGPSTSTAPHLQSQAHRSLTWSHPQVLGHAAAAVAAAAGPSAMAGQLSARGVHGAGAGAAPTRQRPQANGGDSDTVAVEAADDPDLALLLREFPLPMNGSEPAMGGEEELEELPSELQALPPGVPLSVHIIFEKLQARLVASKKIQLSTTRRCHQAAGCWKRLVALYGRQKAALRRRTGNLDQQLKQQAWQLEQQGLQLRRQADELQAQRMTHEQQIAQQVQAVRVETQARIDDLGLAVREAQLGKQTQELRAATAEAEVARLKAALATSESTAAAASAQQADRQQAQEEITSLRAQYRAEQEARAQMQTEIQQLEAEVGRLQTALVAAEGQAAAAVAERDAALAARESAAAAAATAAARQGGMGFVDPYGRPFTPRRSDLGSTAEDDRMYIENLEDTICRLQADVTRILEEKTRIMAERSAERADMETRLMRWQQMARRRTSGRPAPDAQPGGRGRMGPPPPPNRQQYQGHNQSQYNYMAGGRSSGVDIWQAGADGEEMPNVGEMGGGGDQQMPGGEGRGGFTEHAAHGYGDGNGGGGEGYRQGSGPSGAAGGGGTGRGGMGGS